MQQPAARRGTYLRAHAELDDGPDPRPKRPRTTDYYNDGAGAPRTQADEAAAWEGLLQEVSELAQWYRARCKFCLVCAGLGVTPNPTHHMRECPRRGEQWRSVQDSVRPSLDRARSLGLTEGADACFSCTLPRGMNPAGNGFHDTRSCFGFAYRNDMIEYTFNQYPELWNQSIRELGGPLPEGETSISFEGGKLFGGDNGERRGGPPSPCPWWRAAAPAATTTSPASSRWRAPTDDCARRCWCAARPPSGAGCRHSWPRGSSRGAAAGPWRRARALAEEVPDRHRPLGDQGRP